MATMPSGFAKLGCREWAGRSITIVPWSAAASGGGLQLLENTTPTYWSYFGIFWFHPRSLLPCCFLCVEISLLYTYRRLEEAEGFGFNQLGKRWDGSCLSILLSTDLVSISETHAARSYTDQVRRSPYDDICSQTRGCLNGLVIK